MKLLKPIEALAIVHYCPRDNNPLERDYGTPSTIVKEILESPLWPRKVEQFANSAELIEENESKLDQIKTDKDL